MTTTQANATATTKANASARRKSTRTAAEKDTAATQTTAKKAAPKKEAPKKDLNLTVSEEKPEEKFQSMCGFEYDPAPASSCNQTCSKDNPDAYKACLDNFEKNGSARVKKAATKKKATRGKNVWGHLNGCQGSLIDDVFLNGGAHTLEEIMKAAGATRARTLSHLKHLVDVWKVDLRITEDKKYFITGYGSEGLEGKKTNGVKVSEDASEEK
jgi:hypothetical protein